jgi:hypothetical protein
MVACWRSEGQGRVSPGWRTRSGSGGGGRRAGQDNVMGRDTHLPVVLRSPRVALSCRCVGSLWGGDWTVEEGLTGHGACKCREGGAQVAVCLLQLPPAIRIRGIQPDSATEESAASGAASAGISAI